MSDHRVIFGDALDVLRGMDAESVDCCATSPPYWGLRDYGVDGQLGLEATPEAYVARLVGVRDLGYHPACRCQGHSARSQPGLVLDPFCGSGTTIQVARKLGRRSIGIELNPAYEAVMRQRLGCGGGLFEDVSFEEATP